MKNLFSLLLLSSFLISCNPTLDQPEVTAAMDGDGPVEELAIEVDLVPIDSDEALLATALMAAPEASRENCTVIGWNMAGEFVTFREGTNEFICLADDPRKDGFNAACYHKTLEPFMARGRALKAEGKSAKDVFDIREEEVKAGKLSMGETGATLHIYFGPETDYDPATGTVAAAKYRYVVYMPFATAASTGLPESPIAPNHPWIMNPGTHRAHIMISPVNRE